ncbi:IS66 family transposase [Blautia obeum]|jgi:transposase|uniref:IS66 family transposase n=1 Tax=Blautia obeum TaxID=40520 RepID=A0A414IA36_9FIRM|nr:IS66 family transposase [Blautia obeum]MCB6334354.1 IS66 family transposase [Blautia obeum]MCQ4791273.1 IS66 family transposase [Blautia obeum]MCQ5358726.1 IS66 family transposase [Blautia obeum]MZT68616.1 IS66 family transposase [Blautia obeum]NSJ95928.1 IS66 family transposase [Blautia obeum]
MAKVYTEEELNSFSRETLMAVILSMQDQISQLNANMERLIEQIADANSKRYGRSSEKLETISGQLELELIFNEAEALTETLYVVEPVEEDVIQPRHRKSKGKREADLKDLPVEVISHTLSEERLQDVFGTDGWKQLPDEIYKRVRVQPAVYTVEEHHVAVYAGKDNQTIIKVDRPKDLLRNSLLTPSLAASIMNAKYVNGLPLYRISQEFLRNDIHISRQVMANWMIQCADRYLGILYDRLHKEMYRFHVLQADETPVMVTKDGRPANSKSYMWIYRTGKSYTDTPVILYEYQRTRKSDHPEEFLKDFKGIMVCDGYSAYRKLDRKNPDIIFAGCWSHARRRFTEALKALPKTAQKNAKETVDYEAVSRIAAIYHLDNQMEGQPAKVRKMYRQANIRPLVEAFFAWAKEIQSKNQLSRGKTLDGINYCINQEASLKAFLEDGDIPMDNNATESALRSFCLHKHTWKLIDSLDGANASAIIYSITETAKANNLNPFRYLEYVLTVLKDHQDDRDYGFIDDILPWSEKLPEICRNKAKTTNI